MSSSKSKFQDFYDKFILGVGEVPADGDNVKIPFFMLCFAPWGMLLNNFRMFWKPGLLGALAISAVSLAMGYGYVCNYQRFGEVNFYCSETLWTLIPYSLCYMLLLSVFAFGWVSLLRTQTVSWKEVLSQPGRIFRFLGMMLAFLAVNCVPLLSLLILYFRVPNPDWRIEIAFFAVVSLGFLVPFAAMRFLSLLGFSAESETLPPLWKVWLKSRGNLLRILFALVLILFSAMFVFNSFFFNFRALSPEEMPYSGIVVEYLYNFFVLIFFTIFLNHCLLQKQYLFGETENERQ